MTLVRDSDILIATYFASSLLNIYFEFNLSVKPVFGPWFLTFHKYHEM